MVIAALLSFGILLVAWIVAPDGHAEVAPAAETERDALPIAA